MRRDGDDSEKVACLLGGLEGGGGGGGGGEAVGTQKVNMQLFCGGDKNCVIAIMIMIMIKIKIINKAWKCFLSELS